MVIAVRFRHTLGAIPPHLWVAISGWSTRVLSAFLQLWSVKLLLQNLGLEDYAVLALLTGLQGWFLLADLGVGVSVQNHLSENRARGESGAAILAAGRLVAIVLLALTMLLLFTISPFLAPALLKAFPDISLDQKGHLFFVSGALSIGFGIGSIVYKVWYAQQRGYLSNVVPAIAACLGLLGVWLCHLAAPERRLMLSLVALMGPPAILPLAVLTSQAVGSSEMRHLLCRVRTLDVRKISQRAIAFWAFAVMATVTLQIDYVVLSQFLSPGDITVYTLASKIFGLAFFVYNTLLMALWPLFAELITNHDWDRVRYFLRRYLVAGVCYMTVGTFAMFWLMPAALQILAPGQHLRVPISLTVMLGAYYVIRVWSDTFSMLLQSISKLRPFWLFVPIQAVLSASSQWVLAPRYGLHGVVAGLIFSFLITVAWGLPLASRRYSK